MALSRRVWFLAAWLLLACGPATALPTVVPSTPTPRPTITPPRLEPTLTSIGYATPAPTPTPSAPPDAGATTTPVRGTVAPPSINRFTISPAEIRPGDTVRLEWDVSASEASLYRLNERGQLSEWYAIGLTGSLDVVTSPEVRNQVGFVLFAINGQASTSAFASASVTCTNVWFFPTPPGSCPRSEGTTGLAVTQAFEHGRMFWLSWNRLIYILFDDALSPRWSITQDSWQPGMPEDDPALVPPAGLVQPVRGFGRVWRGDADTYLNARERLGWALEQERSYDSTLQCDSAPKYVTCYLQGRAGEVYVLLPERSGWYVWVGPTPTPPFVPLPSPAP